MKRLDRYMWRELFVPFLIGSVGVLLMFQANYLIFQFKSYAVTSVPWTATLQMLLFSTPKYLAMVLPIATSLATSLAMSRITRETELTAIRSTGTPILRVIAPVAVFGLVVSALAFYVAETVQPAAAKATRKLAADIYVRAAAPDFKSNVTINLASKVAIIGTVSRGERDTVNLFSVVLYERPAEDRITMTFARTGRYQDGIWTLDKPQIWSMEGDTLLRMKPRDELVIREPITVESLFAPPEPEELTTAELKRAIEDNRKQGLDTRRGEIKLHERFSVPTSCLIFAIVSPIFSVYFARSGAFLGVLLSIFVVMGYYNLYIISTEIFGPNGYVSPLVAAWLPNLVFAALGVFGLRRLE